MVNPNIICTFAKNYRIMAKKNTSKPAKRRKKTDDEIELNVCHGSCVDYGCAPSHKIYKADVPLSYRTKAKVSKTKVKSD